MTLWADSLVLSSSIRAQLRKNTREWPLTYPSQGRCCRFLLVIRNPWWDPSENTILAKEVLGISSLLGHSPLAVLTGRLGRYSSSNSEKGQPRVTLDRRYVAWALEKILKPQREAGSGHCLRADAARRGPLRVRAQQSPTRQSWTPTQ